MKKAIICFTRVPRPGLTKTRLMPMLSGEQCAMLHTAFLLDIAEVYRISDADLFVSFAPDPDIQPLRDIFPFAAGFFPQQGSDLGERMFNAIAYVIGLGYDAVILTGSDLPRLTYEHISCSFAALEKADVVIGPTSDGGYYLIGMKRASFAPFDVQGYGGSTVYQSTINAISKAGLTFALAPMCDDTDTPEDLHALAKAVSPDSHTGKYLYQLGKDGIPL
ncbi:MAG: TIGR04282 family arsenosugar biosynthesis glycosyltransferase [Clostridia bacterium]|nr:TIGR04282 family arsenosugar biosynthesis glycosyltransferase [Clostridia bacterium]